MGEHAARVAAIETEIRAHVGENVTDGRLPDGCGQPEVQHVPGGAITMVQNSHKPLPGGMPGK